jgi:CYTH domain-containing protein
MAQEIERKFLVAGDGWKGAWPSTAIRQGYLSTDPDRVVRVRVAGGDAFLTIKGRPATGTLTRPEFEYPIPRAEAEWLLDHLCLQPVIVKSRHRVTFESAIWEVDEFEGVNAGLVLAEIELERADQPIALPDWIGAEVTADPRYTNASLARNPYRAWGRPATTGKAPGPR